MAIERPSQFGIATYFSHFADLFSFCGWGIPSHFLTETNPLFLWLRDFLILRLKHTFSFCDWDLFCGWETSFTNETYSHFEGERPHLTAEKYLLILRLRHNLGYKTIICDYWICYASWKKTDSYIGKFFYFFYVREITLWILGQLKKDKSKR